LTFLCLHVYAQKNPFEFRPLKGKVKSVSIKAQSLLSRNDTIKFAMGDQIDRAAFQYDDHKPFRFEYDNKGNMVYQNYNSAFLMGNESTDTVLVRCGTICTI